MAWSQSADLNSLGNQHFSKGFYTEAFQCYAQALEVDRTNGDHRALATTLGNLGNICAVSGRREQARAYYTEVLELQKILGEDRGISTTLANLGNLSADAGEWERARAYYLEALDIMNRLLDYAGKAVLLSDLGLVARETGQEAEALDFYQESLVLMRRVGNDAGQADVFRMMARLYLNQHRIDEAQSCTLTSLDVARRLKDELRMGGAWYVLASCHEARGEWQQAIHYLQKVVHVDEKYQLPKLAENTQRLQALSTRVATSSETSHE